MNQTDPFYKNPSMTQSFKKIELIENVSGSSQNTPYAVVIGGGTGASVSIKTLLSLGFKTDAVVAMADDGGSTGLLRKYANATPPGDVRKCLAAFAGDVDDPLTKAFKYRFSFADNHSLGNLLISSLEDITHSFPQAIEICENLLHVKGHVYPSTLNKVNFNAKNSNGAILHGQSEACQSDSYLVEAWLTSDGEICAYEKALDAITSADLIVLGPGSLFTSIISNLLVSGVCDALNASNAVLIYVSSLVDVQGETRGLDYSDCINILKKHGLSRKIDYVITNNSSKMDSSADEIRFLFIDKVNTNVVVGEFPNDEFPQWHDPALYKQALQEIAQRCHLL